MAKPISYDEFRTGTTYAEVYYMIYHRKWKRRHGVLGFWHELKIRLYGEYYQSVTGMEWDGDYRA